MKGSIIKNLLIKGLLGLTLIFVLMTGNTLNVGAVELGNEQDLPVKNYVDDSGTTIKARFNGSIPFVELSSLYHLLFGDDAIVDLIEPGVYEVKTENGKAIIDTENDSLYSDNYSNFIAAPSDDSGDDENIPKMIKGMDYQTKGTATPTSIDFTKYGVDFYAENDKIWLPASAGLNIFMQMGFYDGNILNIIDSRNTEVSSTAEYKAKLQNLFNNKQRFSEYAKEAYNGLCFVFDVFYGHPERNQLSESIANSGLDATLKNYNDETRLIRDWLLSDSLVEYYTGLVALDAALYDGGHTNLVDTFQYDFLFDAYPGLANTESYELYKNLEFYKLKPLSYWFRIMKIADARKNSLGTEKYTEKGDTAIYSFDGFSFDMSGGWNRYYENDGEYPEDTLGGILKALDRALENPNIKNFVFDVSNNSGGMALVAPMIMNYLGYDNILHEKNTITGQIEEIGLKIDINRDGVYDEKDRISKYHFNYGVLTSEFTFSTGNLFVAMAKDNNFAILGERSGGGACNLTTYNTSEGVIYTMSAASCSQNKFGESVDLGTVPDYDLIEMIGVEKNYAKFYNLDILSSLLNDFYKTEESDSAESNNTTNTKNKRKTPQSGEKDELPLADDISEENTTPEKPTKTEPKKPLKEAEKAPKNNVVVYIIVSTVAATGAIGIGLYIRKVIK